MIGRISFIANQYSYQLSLEFKYKLIEFGMDLAAYFEI